MLGALIAVLAFHACLAIEPLDLTPRVTDGVEARPHEFPYQVSLQWGIPPLLKYRHVCGGSIINERYILTAGHCILRLGKLRIAAGKHYVHKSEGETEQIIQVEKKIVHQHYEGGVNPYDIALLRLKTPLTFNKFVQPIRLPDQGENQVGMAVLSGWGSISKRLLPKLPAVLQKAYVPLMDNPTCLEKLHSQKSIFGKKPKLYESQICSGDSSSVSACSGDSGGPLAQHVNGVYVQVGIVSWGFYPCGRGMPSVYTRVASFSDWIKQHAF